MTAETYADLMAAADRAETHCGPGFARGIREHTRALAITSGVRLIMDCPHDPGGGFCVSPCAFNCPLETDPGAPAARVQLLERARQDVDRIALAAESRASRTESRASGLPLVDVIEERGREQRRDR